MLHPNPSTLPSADAITTLIIVCCHAIWLGGPTKGLAESEWAIEPFQHGETQTFITHAETGVNELLKANGSSILIFSGGATKHPLTNLSEAESYHNLIRARSVHSASQTHLSEYILEERFAVDSFQNLLLSLLLFCRHVGRAPERIVLVSHAFKERRFLEGHCVAVRWPVERVVFRGIDPEWAVDGVTKGKAEEGENRARREWAEDWWGWGGVLGAKRMKRGWRAEDKMDEVVFWEGGESRREGYGGILPWDDVNSLAV